MPIYEFRCRKCDKKFEFLCLSSEGSDAACPSCGEKDLERLLSSFCSRSASGLDQNLGGSAGSSCRPSGGFS